MKKLQPRIDRESIKTEVELLKKLKSPTPFERLLQKMLEFEDSKRISFEDLFALI